MSELLVGVISLTKQACFKFGQVALISELLVLVESSKQLMLHS